jgi:hypothetical protein
MEVLLPVIYSLNASDILTGDKLLHALFENQPVIEKADFYQFCLSKFEAEKIFIHFTHRVAKKITYSVIADLIDCCVNDERQLFEGLVSFKVIDGLLHREGEREDGISKDEFISVFVLWWTFNGILI